jgi:hypothetical protein
MFEVESSMAFPRRFKHLIELELDDIESPDYAWLTYAVCACYKDSCGWGGWMIGAVFHKTEEEHPSSTGDKVLPAMMDQVCPSCGKALFRTGASIRLERSTDQTPPLIEGIDYVASDPIEYED